MNTPQIRCSDCGIQLNRTPENDAAALEKTRELFGEAAGDLAQAGGLPLRCYECMQKRLAVAGRGQN